MENKTHSIVTEWRAVDKGTSFGHGPMEIVTHEPGILYYTTDNMKEIPQFLGFDNFKKLLEKSFEQREKDILEKENGVVAKILNILDGNKPNPELEELNKEKLRNFDRLLDEKKKNTLSPEMYKEWRELHDDITKEIAEAKDKINDPKHQSKVTRAFNQSQITGR